MKEPLISVIIPVYNTQDYIERCIQSIQDNTYTNLEIICVNDGSRDNSLDVLQSLAEKDARIKVIDKPNGGVSSARNAGMDIATGEYIAFVDSDDWVHKDFFALTIEAIRKNNVNIVVAKSQNVYSDDTSSKDMALPAFHVSTVSAYDAMVTDGYIRRSPWGRIYQKASIGMIRFPLNIHFGEDAIFNILVATSSNCSFAVLDVPLYYYYQARANSLVHSKNYLAEYSLGSWYLRNINMFKHRDIALYAACSALLSYRYEGSFSPERKTVRKNAKSSLKQCWKLLSELPTVPFKRKLRYALTINFPLIYRVGIIAADRTYLHYEKLLKEKYAAQL